MGIWQVIWLGLMMLSLGINLAHHGRPKTGKDNFWYALVGFGIHFVILYYGGFFR